MRVTCDESPGNYKWIEGRGPNAIIEGMLRSALERVAQSEQQETWRKEACRIAECVSSSAELQQIVIGGLRQIAEKECPQLTPAYIEDVLTLLFPSSFADSADIAEGGHARADTSAADASTSPATTSPVDTSWQRPSPLAGNVDLPPFPFDALPDVLREWTTGMAVATQTPVDLPAIAGLTTVSACCAGANRVVIRLGWEEPTNLYTVVISEPGTRKSAVHKAACRPLVQMERTMTKELLPTIREARRQKELMQREIKGLAPPTRGDEAELKAFEQRRCELEERLAAFAVPIAPRLLVDDITPERLATLMAKHAERMAVMSAEGGIFALMAGRYGSMPNLEVFLKGHSGDTLRVDRVAEGRCDHLDDPCLTMSLTVQPDVMREVVGNPMFRGRGLPARFLLSYPVSLVGRRQIAPPPLDGDVSGRYARVCERLLRRSLDTPRDQPHYLRLDARAQEAFQRFERWLEPQLAEDGYLAGIPDWGGKLAGAVARIAGLFRLTAEEGAPNYITEDDIERAAKLGDYFVEHALYAFEELPTERSLVDARRIRRWIIDHGLREVSLRDCYTEISSIKSASQARNAIDHLVECGYVRERPASSSRRPGRPRGPVYEVNPHILGDGQAE